MSHNLETVNGRTSFASTRRELPWHGLGQLVDNAMTADEVVDLSGLDYDVAVAPNFIRVTDIPGLEGRTDAIQAPSFSTYRTDTLKPLGTVGERYVPIQNRDAFRFFDSLVARKEALYETAGVLGNGEVAFISAKLPSIIKLRGEEIENYVLLIMTHDGTRSLQAQLTPVRVVCNNTLSAALENRTDVRSIRHTASATDRLKEAAATMGLMDSLTAELAEAFHLMQRLPVTDSEARAHLKHLLIPGATETAEGLSTRAQNILNSAETYYHTGPGQPQTVGTAWGLYNAVTGYQGNVRTYRDNGAKFQNLILNGGHEQNSRALNYCLSL